MPRFRPRISLLSALLLITIAGMAIVIVQLWREVGPLRAELVQLRNETGHLSVDDPTKIHAIQVRTYDKYTWKWRIWVPHGQHVMVHWQWGNVPRTGVPKNAMSLKLPSGEQWIALAARRDEKMNQWAYELSTKLSSSRGAIENDAHWFDSSNPAFVGEGVQYVTYVEDDDGLTILLYRLRVRELKNASDLFKLNEPTRGFIIWLEGH